MTLPAAVLWDMDGLLVDTEPVWTVAETDVCRRLGGEFTMAVKEQMIGNRLDVAVPIMVRAIGSDADTEAVMQMLLERMVELFAAELVPQPGAIELLDALAGAGVPSALVSSSYRCLVDAVLPWVGADRFAVTIAGDEVSQPKPHPEPYLTAARALGVDPAACVVLEDSLTGAMSAVAAGIPCVVVPSSFGVHEHPGFRVMPSLAELTPAGLLP